MPSSSSSGVSGTPGRSSTAISDAFGAPVTIEDAEGRLLYGDAAAGTAATRVPVTHHETSLGWVAGPPHARTVAAVLDHLVAQGDGEEGARRRGAAPVPRDQPDLQLLGEAGRRCSISNASRGSRSTRHGR